jgi:hypothetical protein
MVWTGLIWFGIRGQSRELSNMIMFLRVLKHARKFLNICKVGGLSRRAYLHGLLR